MAVAGVALTWKYVGLLLAAGYGPFFIPEANVVVSGPGFVPDPLPAPRGLAFGE
jgi:hypothetical protein